MLPPSRSQLSSAELLAVEQFIQVKGVTQCPTAYAVPIHGAVPLGHKVPSYDVEFYSKPKQEQRHTVRDMNWTAAQFRWKRANPKKRNKRQRPKLPKGV